MGLAVLFFWVGLAGLLLAALVLGSWVRSESRAAAAAAPCAGAGERVHAIRRGRVRLSIWRGEARGDAARFRIAVDRRGPDCGDCMDCVNQAIRWIREHEAAA
jgi:hypothetical protein